MSSRVIKFVCCLTVSCSAYILMLEYLEAQRDKPSVTLYAAADADRNPLWVSGPQIRLVSDESSDHELGNSKPPGRYKSEWVSTDPNMGSGYWQDGEWVLTTPTGQGYWQGSRWISTDPNASGSGYWRFVETHELKESVTNQDPVE